MRLRGWWGVLLQVLLLGVCGAVLAALAQPDLSAASDPSSVLSSRLVPWVAGMLMLALPLAWLGYRWAWASAAAEMLVLLGSGSAAALALVIDRRSFLTAGVAYLGILIGWALSSGDDGLSIPLLLLILGAFLTAMGTWWTDLRGALMRVLPDFPGKTRLPPYARAS